MGVPVQKLRITNTSIVQFPVGEIELNLGSGPKRSISLCQCSVPGSSQARSQSETVDFGTSSFSAAWLRETHFSCRLIQMRSPGVFIVVGNAFRGIRFAEMWLRETDVFRSDVHYSATSSGLGQSSRL